MKTFPKLALISSLSASLLFTAGCKDKKNETASSNETTKTEVKETKTKRVKSTAHLATIPANASFVFHIDGESLHSKGKFSELDKLQSIKNSLTDVDAEDREMIEKLISLVKEPNNNSLDILNDLYIFGSIQGEDQYTMGLAAPMLDRAKFKEFLQTIDTTGNTKFVDDGSITYTFDDDSIAVLGWNDEVALFLLTAEKSNSNIYTLFKEQMAGTNSLKEDKNFSEFLKNKKDMSIWLATKEWITALADSSDLKDEKGEVEKYLKTIFPNEEVTLKDLIDNNYLQIFGNFEKGAVKFSAKPFLNSKLQTLVDKYNIQKNAGISKETLAQLPGENVYLSLYTALDMHKVWNFVSNALTNYQQEYQQANMMSAMFLSKNIEEVVKSFGGDIAILASGSLTVDKMVIPNTTLAFSMADPSFFSTLATKIEGMGMLKNEGEYHSFSHPSLMGVTLYAKQSGNTLLLTTDNSVAKGTVTKNYANNSVGKEFIGTVSGGYINLDINSYSEDLKKGLINSFKADSFEQALNEMVINGITFMGNKDYSANLNFDFKNRDENALYQWIRFTDTMAAPKFQEAVHKARASEVPTTLAQIVSAEMVYNAETGEYLEVKAHKDFQAQLGVTIDSDYFSYKVVKLPENNFKAIAEVTKPFGKLKVGDQVWCDANGVKEATPNSEFASLLKYFLN